MLRRVLSRVEESEIKRTDDNLETLKKRFKGFLDSTIPVVDVFKSRNQVVELDGEKTTTEILDQFLHLNKLWKLE